jgi:hypothetical protein
VGAPTGLHPRGEGHDGLQCLAMLVRRGNRCCPRLAPCFSTGPGRSRREALSDQSSQSRRSPRLLGIDRRYWAASPRNRRVTGSSPVAGAIFAGHRRCGRPLHGATPDWPRGEPWLARRGADVLVVPRDRLTPRFCRRNDAPAACMRTCAGQCGRGGLSGCDRGCAVTPWADDLWHVGHVRSLRWRLRGQLEAATRGRGASRARRTGPHPSASAAAASPRCCARGSSPCSPR